MKDKGGGGPILRKEAALEFVGLRSTQFDAKVASGELPEPIKLSDSGRAVAWLRCELELWLASRIAKRDKTRAGR